MAAFLVQRLLGIDTQQRYKKYPVEIEDRARNVLRPCEAYFEQEPTVGEWLRELVPTTDAAKSYVRELFPCIGWVPRYNLRWLAADSIAGITIGFVVIPQAVAYALLARLSPEFGLYTSFTGALLYWLFGTSRDIVIGTTAVGSLVIGNVVATVQDAMEKGEIKGKYTADEIARTTSLLAGLVLLVLGFLRLGWIIEFIPYISISAFVTAASITIMSTQVPTMLGITGINSREATYKVIINTIKGLPNAGLDAAIGVSALALLFAVRDLCSHMEKTRPHQKRIWSTLSSLRQVLAMILFTFIAWIVHKDLPRDAVHHKFRLVGSLSRGFQKAGVPVISGEVVSHILPELPAIVIILVIEHIAIAKSFGTINNYTVIPSQEVLAQGFANLLSPFVGGYVCTGSFGASAVLSKTGVRTPLAGLFSAFILILALYALTGVFFYIPNAALAGLIIHAVINLLAPPANLFKYWQLSPIEFVMWVVGVCLAIFQNLEISIYATTAMALTLLLVRHSRTQGRFLGHVSVYKKGGVSLGANGEATPISLSDEESAVQTKVLLPLDQNRVANPHVNVAQPYPGVFVYRFPEGFNYTNSVQHVATLKEVITSQTRRTTAEVFERESDRLWCDDGGVRSAAAVTADEAKPLLRAVVLDCAAVNNTDITAVTALVELRNFLDRYARPEPVEWHFGAVNNRWTRRALAVAGFGFPAKDTPGATEAWLPVYAVAPLVDGHAGRRVRFDGATQVYDLESASSPVVVASAGDRASVGSALSGAGFRIPDRKILKHEVDTVVYEGDANHPSGDMATLYGVNRPFFHHDALLAVEQAVRDATRADQRLRSRPGSSTGPDEV